MPIVFQLFYLLPVTLALAFSALTVNDESIWRKESKKYPSLNNVNNRVVGLLIITFVPIVNIFLVFGLAFILYHKLRDPEEWYKW